jgi:hypothetical protein
MKLTTQQVADRYNVSTREVLYAVKRDLVKAEKIGWIWTFEDEELPKKWPVRRKLIRRGC